MAVANAVPEIYPASLQIICPVKVSKKVTPLRHFGLYILIPVIL